MPLALIVESLDDLPEEVKSLYRPHDGKFMLDLDDVEQHPSVTGIKTALEKEKAQRKERGDKITDLEKQLSEIGLTAEEAAELRKLRDDQEAEQARKTGDIEKIVEQRTSRLRADYEAQLAARDREITTITEDRDGRVAQLSKLTIDSQVSKEAAALGVLPKAIDLVSTLAADTWRLDEAGNAVAYTADNEVQYGKDGKPLNMAEWVASIQEQRPYLFDGPKGGGASSETGGGGPGRPGQISLAADSNAIGKNLEAVAEGKVTVTDFAQS